MSCECEDDGDRVSVSGSVQVIVSQIAGCFRGVVVGRGCAAVSREVSGFRVDVTRACAENF